VQPKPRSSPRSGTRHRAPRGAPSGRPIDLTAKEFALLELLLRKKGVVVTRGMILDRVWDLDYDGGSNLVEVYINYLRRKVDQDFEPKLIQTVRGSGYVLREPA
jgi:DNA-binding response OmpR family regulator